MGINQAIKVNIRNLAVGGDGVGEVIEQSNGRTELLGITAFVPYTAMGEVVSATVTEKKDRYLRGELLDVETRSPERVVPACEYYGTCGGCDLQHMSFAAQKSAKEQMIAGSLKAGKVGQAVIDVIEPLIQAEPFQYRRRISLHIDSSGRVGFYRSSSRSVVPVTSCKVAVPAIDQLLARIQQFGKLVAGKISTLQLEADDQGVVAVLISPTSLNVVDKRTVISTAKEFFENVSLSAGGDEIDGFGRQILQLPINQPKTIALRVPAGHFSQVNWEINVKLVEHVVAQALSRGHKRVLDLYCGAGNYSIPLARAGADVTAVEADAKLVTFGRQNAERFNLKGKLTFVASSVERFFSSKDFAGAEVVVANPPRSGLGSVIREIPEYVSRLVLISCHLPSLVRDLRGLTELGWSVEEIQPFDMFAQTSYVEILTVFNREVER